MGPPATSTADDLLAFSRMLLRGGAPVLPADAVTELTRDQLTPEQKAHGGLGPGFFDGVSWGYSVSVVTAGERAGAFGWACGFGSTWLADPARDLTVIVLTQRTFDGPGGHPLHDEVQAGVRRARVAQPAPRAASGRRLATLAGPPRPFRRFPPPSRAVPAPSRRRPGHLADAGRRLRPLRRPHGPLSDLDCQCSVR